MGRQSSLWISPWPWDQNGLLRDLASPTFKVGVRRGCWPLLSVKFPTAMFFVGAPVRLGGPTGFLLRSDCSEYPRDGAQLAALARSQQPAAARPAPSQEQGGTISFSTRGACLCRPIDRLARSHWPGQHEEMCWTADKTITFLLETVHGILDSSDYADLPPEFVARHAGAAA